MKKIIVSLMLMALLCGCSGSNDQVIFVMNSENKYLAVNDEGKELNEQEFDQYIPVGTYGYIVSKDGQVGYIDNTGKEIIPLGQYKAIDTIDDMLLATDDKDCVNLISSAGEVIYQEGKNVSMMITGLPVVLSEGMYRVYCNNAYVAASVNDDVIYASRNGDYVLVCYNDKAVVYSAIDSEENRIAIEIDLKGEYELLGADMTEGFLCYDKTAHKAAYVTYQGDVLFNVDATLDNLTFDANGNIVGISGQNTVLFSNSGEMITTNSYYHSATSYIEANNVNVYGPHHFHYQGNVNDVSDIQLDPLGSYTTGDIFPVYVRGGGFMYYNYNGKEAFDGTFKRANTYDDNGLAIVQDDEDRYYLIDEEGNRVGEYYENIENLGGIYYMVFTTSSKYEVIDNTGTKVIDDSFMGHGSYFEYEDKAYGILNKSGTSYVYDLVEKDAVFFVEGDITFDESGYFIDNDKGIYYTMKGEKIYTR